MSRWVIVLRSNFSAQRVHTATHCTMSSEFIHSSKLSRHLEFWGLFVQTTSGTLLFSPSSLSFLLRQSGCLLVFSSRLYRGLALAENNSAREESLFIYTEHERNSTRFSSPWFLLVVELSCLWSLCLLVGSQKHHDCCGGSGVWSRFQKCYNS